MIEAALGKFGHEVASTPRSSALMRILSRTQPRISEIKPIHDLVVFVIRCLARVTGEGVHVGALKVNHAACLLVEEWMLGRIVEIMSVILFVGVGDDLASGNPRSLRMVRLGIPNFTQDRGAQDLGGNHNVAPPVLVPKAGAIVQND